MTVAIGKLGPSTVRRSLTWPGLAPRDIPLVAPEWPGGLPGPSLDEAVRNGPCPVAGAGHASAGVANRALWSEAVAVSVAVN